MDTTSPRASWSLKAFKSKVKPTQEGVSETLQPDHTVSLLRSVFTRRKRMAAKKSEPLKTQVPDPETEIKAADALSPQDQREFLAGPDPTSTTLSRRKLTKQKREASTPTTSVKSKLRHKPSILDACRQRQPPVDILEDIKPGIKATTQKLEDKSWCTSLNRPISLFSLRAVLMAEISPDTRELLKSGFDEMQEYKKKEEEKRKKAEEEKEARKELEKTLEVVDSTIVKRGDEYHRCERLVPSSSSMEPRTFDPRAGPSTATLRSPFETGDVFDGSETLSGKIIERPRGISRRNMIALTEFSDSSVEESHAEYCPEDVVGSSILGSVKPRAPMLKARNERYDSPLESRRESSETEEN